MRTGNRSKARSWIAISPTASAAPRLGNSVISEDRLHPPALSAARQSHEDSDQSTGQPGNSQANTATQADHCCNSDSKRAIRLAEAS